MQPAAAISRHARATIAGRTNAQLIGGACWRKVLEKVLNTVDLERFVESLLFVADGPVSLEDLAKALKNDTQQVEQAVSSLIDASSERGLRVVRSGRLVQMVTMPEAGPAVERFLGLNPSSSLSSAALETLAIIAYRQPVTRAEVAAIRGVNSDGVIRTLMARSLVESIGWLPQAGRPILLGTTFEFLEYFAIASLDELPSLPGLPDYAQDPQRAPG